MIKLRFSIHYLTKWGECLAITGNTADFGEWDSIKAVAMTWDDHVYGMWVVEVEVLALPTDGILKYKYLVKNHGKIVNIDSGDVRLHTLDLNYATKNAVIEVRDEWRSLNSCESVMSTSAFQDCVFYRKEVASGSVKKSPVITTSSHSDLVQVRFQIVAPRVDSSNYVAVGGSIPQMGAWVPTSSVQLNSAEQPLWVSQVAIPRSAFPISYKFLITDGAKMSLWENCENRFLTAPAPDVDLLIASTEEFKYPVGNWRGAGVALPVFSLRSDNGMGVGEFLDIKGLVDWAKKVDLKMVQILPINDTTVTNTWWDSYPYDSLSVCALHPIFLNLPSCGPSNTLLKEITSETVRLNLDSKKMLDYEDVMRTKWRLMRKIFEEQKSVFLSDIKNGKKNEFAAYLDEHKNWLQPYSLFCVYRDETGTSDWHAWGTNASITLEVVRDRLHPKGGAYFEKGAFYYWLQFQLHLQMTSAVNHAKESNVVLKGDLPIGVSPNGCDAWVYPHLFNLDKQTGAPPDYFAKNGQNWGFPTYNWDNMAKNEYKWWKLRLKQMSLYFQAFRIDHILGFFRIWEIPFDAVTGLRGQFSPALPLWRSELETIGLWDMNRLTRPYIRRWHIEKEFGYDTNQIIHTYMNDIGFNSYEFKEHLNTEKKLEQYISSIKMDRDEGNVMKDKLFGFLNNVCLLLDKDGKGNADAFHPRIEMTKTSSFYELENEGMKKAFERLYVSYFFERQEGLWREKAMEKLPALKNASNMLVCGEDLGMVPQCVKGVMEELAIACLRIQRMPADPKMEFDDPRHYPNLCVCTPSVHDTSTIRGWWEEDKSVSQRFYNHMLGRWGEAPKGASGDIVEHIIEQHLQSPAFWSIFPLQDWFGIDEKIRFDNVNEERINNPANKHHYWRYRMHLSLKELNESEMFNSKVRDLVKRTGRASVY